MRKVTLGILMGLIGLLALAGCGSAARGSANSAEPVAVRPGRLASDFTIKLFSGEPFVLKEQRGKAVVVNFWASWCPPCREEAPALERVWRAYRDRGVVMVGLALWDSEQDSRRFIQEFGITYPNGPDSSGEIAIEYGVTGLPETWFLDREGKLVRRWIGAATERQMVAFVEEALR